jgi:hypothetical protein
MIHSSIVIYYCLYISYYEGVDGVYRESWFTQVRLPSVAKTTKIYCEAWGKKYCLSFQNTFQYNIFLPFTDFHPPPPPPHLDPLLLYSIEWQASHGNCMVMECW